MKKSKQTIPLLLEFELSGAKKVPSVSFIGMDGFGVPMTPPTVGDEQNAAFDEFSRAAYKFCEQMKATGEFESMLGGYSG